MIIVVKPGMLTTVQDAGRWGHQHQGIPVAGPMDPWSHVRANRLVGNDASAATLEITLVGPRLQFEAPAVVAICGGEFAMTLSGRLITQNRPIGVETGEELEVGRCARGARAYLAVRGGFDVPVLFGSRATHLPSAMGGLRGRALAAGDVLRAGGLAARAVEWRTRAAAAPAADSPARVLVGPDDEEALRAGLEMLLSSRFEVSPDSNRMGYRLRGPVVDVPPASRLSMPTPMGTIQLPESGAPIVLMADRQTTGGYPRIATVISADLGQVGQLKPGDRVSFVRCSHAEALAALHERLAELDA